MTTKIFAMKKKYILLFIIIFAIWVNFGSCHPKMNHNNDNPMNQSDSTNNDISHSLIISETKDDITYLENIYRDDRITRENLSDTVKDGFFLHFDVNNHSKQRKAGTRKRYTMCVIPINNGYKTKLRNDGDSFYFGDKTGHSQPTGKWFENDELGTFVVNYYIAHQDSIPVHTTSAHIDVSHWKPLFALRSGRDNQTFVLKMTKQVMQKKEFYINCELLHFNNTLVNGKLMNYTLSSYTLHFVPMEGDYWVWRKPTSNKTYTNSSKEPVDTTVSNVTSEGWASEDSFSSKVLEYYLAHKNDIKTMKDGNK